ncbi:MAG TPA: hypothetical protein VGE67_19985 [Haloferula sp.]
MTTLFGDLRIDLATSIELARDARSRGLKHAVAAHLRVIRATRAAKHP